MAKKSRTKARDHARTGPRGEVGPRQPCPCGSGTPLQGVPRRGRTVRPTVFVARPFEGLPGECDVVALRELVPAATAPLTARGRRDRDGAALHPAADGRAGDGPRQRRRLARPAGPAQLRRPRPRPRRRAGQAPSTPSPASSGSTDPPGRGPAPAGPGHRRAARGHRARRLRLLDRRRRGPTPGLAAALEQANAAAAPTRPARRRSRRRTGPTSGTKEHLRWVMPRRRGPAARRPGPAARGRRGPPRRRTSRLVGMFRAHGLLAPVWDLPVGHRRRGARGAGGTRSPTTSPRRWPTTPT